MPRRSKTAQNGRWATMVVLVETVQLLVIAALIFQVVVVSWRLGVKYWSSR